MSDEDVRMVKLAGYDDAQVIEIVQHVALNTWTNYINEVAKTDIDFPGVTARKLREALHRVGRRRFRRRRPHLCLPDRGSTRWTAASAPFRSRNRGGEPCRRRCLDSRDPVKVALAYTTVAAGGNRVGIS